MKITTLYQIRLSKISPAPPIFYALKVEGKTETDRKREFKKGQKAMLDKFPAHKVFEELICAEDAKRYMMVTSGEVNIYLPEGEEI